MRVAVCLLAYSALVMTVGPRLLVRSTRTGRSPRLGILTWQVACWSVAGSWVLAGLAIASPAMVPVDHLRGLLHACMKVIDGAVAPPANAELRLLGAALAAAVAARVCSCALAGLWSDRRQRTRHAAVLQMVGRPGRGFDAVVVDGAEPVAYCLPGRTGRIVLTTEALGRLSGDQLSAVLAHERAHLRGRHHLLLSGAQSLARAFPVVGLFALAAEHTARLVEMRADDAAARRHGRRSVAEALIALADTPAPRASLAATGVRTVQRVERLLAGRPQPARAHLILIVLALVFLSGPVVVSLAPAVGAALQHLGLCPLPR